jgi:chromosomal replication initiator protein
MPQADLQILWQRISDDVRQAIGDSAHAVWISAMRPLAFDGREFLVSAPPGTGMWTASRYGRVLQASTEAVLGDGVVARITPGEAAVEHQLSAGERPAPKPELPANPRFSFEQFVLGPSNRFAHASALAVAENPGTAYNPLFVCGPPGVGKTHLLHSVADYLQRNEPSLRVRLTTAETFVNEFVAAIRGGRGTEAFKQRYRANDVLLVDDVQFLMDKTQTEEEFFHTFNALCDAGAQVMLTSDRVPRELEGLNARLRDRFDAGLVAEIEAPDFATRLAVLRKHAAHSDLPLPTGEAMELIAGRVTTNLRALESAMVRVVAFASLTGRVADEELAAEVLAKLGIDRAEEDRGAGITIESVQETTCRAFGITRDELVSPSKEARIAGPRQLAMWLAREHTSESLPSIGRKFGGRGHTTVLHALRRAEQRIAADPEASALVDDLSKALRKRGPDRGD